MTFKAQRGSAFLTEILPALALMVIIVIAMTVFHKDTQCIGGYLFSNGIEGRHQQILDDQGKGIPCRK